MRILEVGCATGEFLAVARDAGVQDVLGLEVSEYCRTIAAGRGYRVLSPSDDRVLSAVAEFRPNVVVAWDVWEHLAAPAHVFDAYLALAERSATLALTSVDAGSLVARFRGPRWRQFHPPTHLHYPTRTSFRIYFGSRGLAVCHQSSFGYYRPAVEYLRALSIRPRLRAGPLGRLLVYPLYLNLFDIQMVIGSREVTR